MFYCWWFAERQVSLNKNPHHQKLCHGSCVWKIKDKAYVVWENKILVMAKGELTVVCQSFFIDAGKLEFISGFVIFTWRFGLLLWKISGCPFPVYFRTCFPTLYSVNKPSGFFTFRQFPAGNFIYIGNMVNFGLCKAHEGTLVKPLVWCSSLSLPPFYVLSWWRTVRPRCESATVRTVSSDIRGCWRIH